MRYGRRVTRLLAGVGILTIGFASVAQAAGVDRKAYRAARESRVAAAAQVRGNPGSDPVRLNFASPVNVTRLLRAASFGLALEDRFFKAENRLIAQQNRIILRLNSVTRPFLIRRLVAEGHSLQRSINLDLRLLERTENAVNNRLTVLQSYADDGVRIAAAISRLDAIAAFDAARIATIAARPPFTYPPATPGI